MSVIHPMQAVARAIRVTLSSCLCPFYLMVVVTTFFCAPAFSQNPPPPNVEGVSVSPQPVQVLPNGTLGNDTYATITVTWDRPLTIYDGTWNIVLDTGGAPIATDDLNGNPSCTYSPIYIGIAPNGVTSWSGPIGLCGDLFSGTWSLSVEMCSAVCGGSSSGSMSVQAAQYTFSVSPTVIPVGTQATATLTRNPSDSGWGYYLSATLTDCQSSSVQNELQMTYGGNLTMNGTTAQQTFTSNATSLPGDVTCTVSAFENESGNGYPPSNPYGIVGSAKVTFKAPLQNIDGPSCPRSGGEGMCGSPINLTDGDTWVQADDYELPGLGGGELPPSFAHGIIRRLLS